MEQIPLNTTNNENDAATLNLASQTTKLHNAASAGDLKAVKELCKINPHLINEGDDVDRGETALHKAARHGHVNILVYLLSYAEQNITCNKMNRNPLDVAVQQDKQDVAMAIAEHSRWKEFLHRIDDSESQLQTMVIKMPEVATRFLDNCIEEKDGLESDEDLGRSTTYDFRFLQGMPEPDRDNPRHFLDSLKTMVKFKRIGCLTHPVCQAMLMWKWTKLGWCLFLMNLSLYTLFLVCLTVTVILLDDRRYMKNAEWVAIPNAVIIFLCIVQLLKELFQMWEEKLNYFRKFDNWLELFLYANSLAVTLAHMVKHEEEDPTVGLRAAAAAAVFVAWTNFVLYMQRSSYFGIYVIMLKTIIMTLLKLVMLFLPFMFAFGVPFFLLFPNKKQLTFGSKNQTTSSGSSDSSQPYIFDRIGYSLYTTFMMLLGEMKYPHTVYKYQPIKFPWLSYTIYVIFVLCMPIIIKNLLIGLSVGDVKRILQSARMEHHKMQVQLLLELEKMLPVRLLRKFWVAEWTDYPYRKKKWTQKLTSFGAKINSTVSPKDGNDPSKEIAKLKITLSHLSEQVAQQEERLESVVFLLKEIKTQITVSKSPEASRDEEDTITTL